MSLAEPPIGAAPTAAVPTYSGFPGGGDAIILLARLWNLVAAVLSLAFGYGAAQLSVSSPWLGLLAVATVFTAGGRLVYLRVTKRALEEIVAAVEADRLVAGSSIVILVGIATGGFAGTSVLLYDQGVGALSGGQPEGTALATAIYWYYLWHLASSVPLLEIPSTLNWELRYTFTDHVHGALLLAYKVVVIVPLLSLAAYVVARWIRPIADGTELPHPHSNIRSRS